MKLTGIELEKVLNAELVGKDVGYAIYSFASVVFRVIRLLAKEAGLNENDFRYKQVGGSNSSVYLTYKDVSFGEVSFQKQKGKYHYGHYEWTFKKVFVNLWNESCSSYYHDLDFQGMLDKIDADKNVAADEEAKKLEQAKEIFQIIKDKLGCDDFGARQFIDFLNQKKYSIS